MTKAEGSGHRTTRLRDPSTGRFVSRSVSMSGAARSLRRTMAAGRLVGASTVPASGVKSVGRRVAGRPAADLVRAKQPTERRTGATRTARPGIGYPYLRGLLREVGIDHTGAARHRTTSLPRHLEPSAVSALTQLMQDAEPAEVERVLTVTRFAREQTLDPALWGPAPSHQDLATGVLTNLRKQFEGRRELEQASVSRTQAAELLGTSEQAVTDQLEAGRLLGFKRGRRWVIPAWQFDAEAERGFLPGLDALAAVFPGGVVALSTWATRPNPDLGGARPRDELVRGRVDPVVRLARTLTAAGW